MLCKAARHQKAYAQHVNEWSSLVNKLASNIYSKCAIELMHGCYAHSKAVHFSWPLNMHIQITQGWACWEFNQNDYLIIDLWHDVGFWTEFRKLKDLASDVFLTENAPVESIWTLWKIVVFKRVKLFFAVFQIHSVRNSDSNIIDWRHVVFFNHLRINTNFSTIEIFI